MIWGISFYWFYKRFYCFWMNKFSTPLFSNYKLFHIPYQVFIYSPSPLGTSHSLSVAASCTPAERKHSFTGRIGRGSRPNGYD